MDGLINKRFRLDKHDNYDALSQFAFPSWVGNNTNFGYGQQMVGPDIIDAGQQSNPVINHVLRGKPFSPDFNFVRNIPKYAYMFAVNLAQTTSRIRRDKTPTMLLSLEQLNYVLHYLQLEHEKGNNNGIPPITVDWVRTNVTYIGVNNTDRSTTYATGRERDFTILATGTTNIVNIFNKNNRSLVGGDRLWLIAKTKCCHMSESYCPDDVDGTVIVLNSPLSRKIVRIHAVAGPPELRIMPLICKRCNDGENPFDCPCQLRVMNKVQVGSMDEYEHSHIFRVGEVDINRDTAPLRNEVYKGSETNMLKFNMNRRIMAILNT